MTYLLDAVILFALVASGIMAGVYYAFSVFVMRALDALEAPAGMLAMQSINRVILKTSFLPLFFTSSVAAAGLAVVAALDLSAPGAVALLLASIIYFAGMFLVTVVGNVPLNNALEATPGASPEAEQTWRHYRQRWTAWNHVRTLSCIIALALYALAFAAR
ncbi:DUF1772 domain-containing protein [Gimibacter soli]|uniref:DUF1772 domain-containing protein n=1 Tax=Gimibacter soli TaxID=3024400 RepID=A0AAE9XUE8_9PROT|nr:anthrone oxygenase family protein [Gimibacter soli]WCL52914.1 DUF1772 domain-containing protein [Gimibacter soli]